MDGDAFKKLAYSVKSEIIAQILEYYRSRNHLFNPKNKDFMNRDMRETSLSSLSIIINVNGEFNLIL